MENISFIAETEYSEEAYRALAALMIRKLRKWPRLIMIIVGCVTIVGSSVLMIMQGGVNPLGLIVMLLGNFMFMAGLLAERLCVRMLTASQKKGQTPKNTYLFSEDFLRIRSGEEHKDYAYEQFGRVLEMAGYLFLFMKDSQIYLLSLKGVKGSVGQFRAFLERKLMESRQAKG